MPSNELWTSSEDTKWSESKRPLSMVHLSMLFATSIVAIAMVLTPILAEKTTPEFAYSGEVYDDVVTGSVGQTSTGIQRNPNFGKKQYTIRHSITQSTEQACVIYDNGIKSGGC